MMGHQFGTFLLTSFRSVVQKEVNQDCIDGHARVLPQNVAPNELDHPDRASAQLHLPGMTRLHRPLGFDVAFQRRTVLKTPKCLQELRNAII